MAERPFPHPTGEAGDALRALRESEERYRRLLELLPDAVVTYRGDRISFANPAAARLHGAPDASALVGTPVLDRVPPEEHAVARERMARLAAGEPFPLQQQVLLRMDGTPFQAELAAALLGSGEVLVVLRDVTERERARAERGAIEERLREAERIEALGRLVGGVAHEFNAALAAILGHADALAGELPEGSRWREDAEQIALAAKGARRLVQQLLPFARRGPAEAGPPRPPAPAATPEPRAPAPPPAAPRGRVLLVDDDPPVARAIARMLERSGYEVAVDGDAESALERFREDPAAFDLVFTDQTLPRMRGDELTVALLALRPDLPVLICTGYSELLDDDRARALGARGLLSKPLDVRELAQAVEDAIGRG
jgi:PAS domain S-box-containing protein